jgi:hypothetical protein
MENETITTRVTAGRKSVAISSTTLMRLMMAK